MVRLLCRVKLNQKMMNESPKLAYIVNHCEEMACLKNFLFMTGMGKRQIWGTGTFALIRNFFHNYCMLIFHHGKSRTDKIIIKRHVPPKLNSSICLWHEHQQGPPMHFPTNIENISALPCMFSPKAYG